MGSRPISARPAAVAAMVATCCLVTTTTAIAESSARWFTQSQAGKGREVYQTYCIGCHAPHARGQPDWKNLNDQKLLPPPPLNGTGHAWHHTLAVLRGEILTGSTGDPFGNMPPFAGVLDETQIVNVIAWLQSLWPDEIYEFWWREMQRENPGFEE